MRIGSEAVVTTPIRSRRGLGGMGDVLDRETNDQLISLRRRVAWGGSP
jgi:hypothetical protein